MNETFSFKVDNIPLLMLMWYITQLKITSTHNSSSRLCIILSTLLSSNNSDTCFKASLNHRLPGFHAGPLPRPVCFCSSLGIHVSLSQPLRFLTCPLTCELLPKGRAWASIVCLFLSTHLTYVKGKVPKLNVFIFVNKCADEYLKLGQKIVISVNVLTYLQKTMHFQVITPSKKPQKGPTPSWVQ